MTHMSNLLSTTALDGRFPFKAFTKSLLKLDHLHILDLTIYVFINKKKKKAKSAKWKPIAKKRMLVAYDNHTIYHVYLPDKEKVICIKDLKIVKNADKKADNQLTYYNAITAS